MRVRRDMLGRLILNVLDSTSKADLDHYMYLFAHGSAIWIFFSTPLF